MAGRYPKKAYEELEKCRKIVERLPGCASSERQGEMRIIAFIDQPDVIKKILQHLGLWEDSHAPPERSPPGKELTFDPSYSQVIKAPYPNRGADVQPYLRTRPRLT